MMHPPSEEPDLPAAALCGRCGNRLDPTPSATGGSVAVARAEAEARLGWLLEHASDIVSVIDADGIIRYESPSVERLLGWRPEDLVGTRVFEYIHPDDVAGVGEALARRIADPAPVNSPTEFRVRARDGSWHVLAAMSRVTRDEAGAESLVVNSRDVTEQRALEERLRQAQRIESIGQLAGGIAHDFNNLLTVIIGRSELLSGRLAPDDPIRRGVEIIKAAARRGAALTQQLLAFGRKQMLSPTTLDLNAVVMGIAPELERLVGEQRTMLTSLDRDLRPTRGDRASIEQAIVALVSHARDATSRDGRISLTTANVELDDAFVRANPDATLGPHALLTVGDTGAGLDAETRARIFEPFFVSRGLARGAGLELAAVHGIVKQHGGHIRVESAPGLGTRFRIYLPTPPLPAESTGPATGDGRSTPGTWTILLVEDEPEVLDLAKQVLEAQGYHVLAAPGPREALEIATWHDGPLHLLLTDVVMPDMNGRELADRLLQLHPEAALLFMSGYAGEALDPYGVARTGIALIPKPFTLSALTGGVAEALRRR